MKKVASLLPVLLSSFVMQLVAQEEAYDASYLSITREYILHTNNTTEYRYSKKLKLQNYRAFHRLFGETFIIYNPHYQKLTIDSAYAVMAGGKNVVTPPNAFNEVLPQSASHAPPFNGLREMVITHTGLEIGATVCLDYRIVTQADFFPAFMGSPLLAEDQPVKSQTVVIRVPEKRPLFYRLFHSEEQPMVSRENGFDVYTWRLTGIPATSNEPHRPPNQALYPTLIFSTLDSYLPLARFLFKQEALRYLLPESAKRHLNGMNEDTKEKKEQVFALQDLVVKEIKLFDIPEEYAGYRLRTPQEVWNSNGGTVAEKAVLLTALLREEGIQAEPALVFAGAVFSEGIGTLTTEEEWLVRVEVPETGELYLSVRQANAFDMSLLRSGEVILVLKDDSTFHTVYPVVPVSRLVLKGMLSVDSSLTLLGEVQGTFTGPSNPYLSFLRGENKVNHYLRGALASAKTKGISFSVLTAGESSFACSVEKTGAFQADGDYFSFSLPALSTGIGSWDIQALVQERDVPVDLPSSLDERVDITLALPDGLSLVSGEQEVVLENPAGRFLFRVEQKETLLHIQKELRIESDRFSPAGYPELKELIDTWNQQQTKILLFRK